MHPTPVRPSLLARLGLAKAFVSALAAATVLGLAALPASAQQPEALLHTLDDPRMAAGDHFGTSMAISGTRVVVGDYNDDTGATDAGSAYVYDVASAMPTVPAAWGSPRRRAAIPLRSRARSGRASACRW